jgi:hypothetical protein
MITYYMNDIASGHILVRVFNICHPTFATCGLYHKHVTIINDASSSINKLEVSLIDAARGIIYDCHMFMVHVYGTSFRTENCLTLSGKLSPNNFSVLSH